MRTVETVFIDIPDFKRLAADRIGPELDRFIREYIRARDRETQALKKRIEELEKKIADS